VKCWRTKAN